MTQSWREQTNGDSLENSKYRAVSQEFAFIRLCAPIQFLQRAAALTRLNRSSMAKVFTIPVLPDPARRRRNRKGMENSDPRYIEGQRVLVEAMKYLVQQDPEQNKDAVMLLSEHFRTRFRITDRPDEFTAPTGG